MAMREKADLTDKSEQLEYVIVQLQGETETIGKIRRENYVYLLLTV